MSLDERGLRTQTAAALALACAIPVLLIGYLTFQYVLPNAASAWEIYGTIGFGLVLAILGTYLIFRTVRQVQSLSRTTRSILDLHALTTIASGQARGENELLNLGLAITKMGDALRQQVTELQDKARELGELNSRLEDANKKLSQYNEMKSNLVVLASREFRNPIGAIMEGTALVLQRQLGDLNESQKRMVTVIHSNACKASRLLEELLTIARVRASSQDFSPRAVDLKEALSKVVTRVSVELARKQVELECRIPVALQYSGYAQETELALECALANAIDLAAEKSTIGVSLEAVGPAAVVSIELQSLALRAISIERLVEVLNSPVSTTRDWNGAGSIELPLAKEIITLIGGRIIIEQSAAARICFRVSLPLAATN